MLKKKIFLSLAAVVLAVGGVVASKSTKVIQDIYYWVPPAGVTPGQCLQATADLNCEPGIGDCNFNNGVGNYKAYERLSSSTPCATPLKLIGS